MHQPPIVPRLNLGNQENVMTERVTMGGPSPRMVEKVTMDLGSSVAHPLALLGSMSTDSTSTDSTSTACALVVSAHTEASYTPTQHSMHSISTV